MLSSAAVRSNAVPNVVTALMNDTGPSGESHHRHRYDAVVDAGLQTAREVEELLEQRAKCLRAARR